ncbi:DUF1657 domain-containing protein [Bacillus sp. 03113]|uniref:DUF1657 domain-containing protein n=1 Tax=Bacillus sp. 03113 TaxID=2578211 RepID=UPI001143AED3|nr:DUF1657 domain-containing protein [Bacillus sp. 03113]
MTIISNVKQCVATINGIEAQLSTLALNSREKMAQKTFHEMMLEIHTIKRDLEARVTEIEVEEPQYKDS